jgi:FkbH-like protein
VFVDDSSHECAAVRHALPQVEVVQTPSRPVEVPFCLDRVARLEVLSLTSEDLAKTEMYAQQRKRRELMETSLAGGGDYLQSLGMKMRISLDSQGHVARLSQLTQKTNQFNLTTRRYDESQIQGFIAGGSWLVADFSLADVFGDSGIVGLAIFALHEEGRAEMDVFLMSCRVIGREAEAAFLHALLKVLAQR